MFYELLSLLMVLVGGWLLLCGCVLPPENRKNAVAVLILVLVGSAIATGGLYVHKSNTLALDFRNCEYSADFSDPPVVEACARPER